MQHERGDNPADALGLMWETHREFLRRLLIGLARDIDLADDLLQESYLKARSGIGGYQGGDSRAWLTAIAKSSFYSHLRLRYVRCEIPLDEDCQLSGAMEDGLDLIEVRRAILDLPEAQRRAIVMKHYGGYNYEDIAAHMECPIGTAKSRVSLALRRLREALAVPKEEIAMVKCADLAERTLMDFVYGRMPESERKLVEKHLAVCDACRERATEVAFVLRALDAVEADFKSSIIMELNDDGTMSHYLFAIGRNTKDEPLYEFQSMRNGTAMGAAFVNNEEAEIELLPSEPGEGFSYTVRVSHPVPPGASFEVLMIWPASEVSVRDLGGGVHRIDSLSFSYGQETAYAIALRLPSGSRFVGATPDVNEIRENGTSAIVWRGVLQPMEKAEFAVEFRM